MMSHKNQEVSRNSYLHAGQGDAAAVSQLWQQLWMLEGSLAHLQTVTNVHAQGAVEGRSGGRAREREDCALTTPQPELQLASPG